MTTFEGLPNNLASFLGPIFLGHCFNWCLFGVLLVLSLSVLLRFHLPEVWFFPLVSTVQTYMYVLGFPKDLRGIRALVWIVYCLDTAQLVRNTCHLAVPVFVVDVRIQIISRWCLPPPHLTTNNSPYPHLFCARFISHVSRDSSIERLYAPNHLVSNWWSGLSRPRSSRSILDFRRSPHPSYILLTSFSLLFLSSIRQWMDSTCRRMG